MIKPTRNAITPAARTVTMEVRPAEPGGTPVPGAVSLQAATTPLTVPTATVDPTVTSYALTPTPNGVSGRVTLHGSVKELADGGDKVTSDALPVQGYGTVGVTWAHGVAVPEDCAVIGFDNIRESGWQSFNLTTVGVDLNERVRAIRRMIRQRTTDPEAAPMVETITARLVVRGTA